MTCQKTKLSPLSLWPPQCGQLAQTTRFLPSLSAVAAQKLPHPRKRPRSNRLKSRYPRSGLTGFLAPRRSLPRSLLPQGMRRGAPGTEMCIGTRFPAPHDPRPIPKSGWVGWWREQSSMNPLSRWMLAASAHISNRQNRPTRHYQGPKGAGSTWTSYWSRRGPSPVTELKQPPPEDGPSGMRPSGCSYTKEHHPLPYLT